MHWRCAGRPWNHDYCFRYRHRQRRDRMRPDLRFRIETIGAKFQSLEGSSCVGMDESHWADVIESIEHIYMTMRRAQACGSDE